MQLTTALQTSVVNLYKSVDRESLGLKLVQRTQIPALCSDYGIMQEMRADLERIEGVHLTRTFCDFDTYVRRRRNAYQQGAGIQ